MSADIDAAVKSGDFLGYICHTYLALTTLSAEVPGPPIFPRLSGMFTEKNVVLRTIRNIEECSIASYIAYHKCAYADPSDEFTLGMFHYRVG